MCCRYLSIECTGLKKARQAEKEKELVGAGAVLPCDLVG